MKKVIALLIVAGLLFSVPAHAIVEDVDNITKGPIKKLGRGVSNLVTCPLEFTKGIGDAKDERGIFAAMTWGVLQGTFNIVKRAMVGVYEIVTFPIPLPRDYKPILTDPEFFLQKDH